MKKAIELMRKALAAAWSQSADQVTDHEARWAMRLVSPQAPGDLVVMREMDVLKAISVLERDGDEHGVARDLRDALRQAPSA